MITNQNMMSDSQPTIGKTVEPPMRKVIDRLPLLETKQQQARDPEAQGMGTLESMDVSQREHPRPIFSRRSSLDSGRALCFRLDMGSDMPERMPRIDYGGLGTTSNDAAIRTAQIFRGVQIAGSAAYGIDLAQSERATNQRSRWGKRSRQAANIHRARELVDEAVAKGAYEASIAPAKVVSLMVVGEFESVTDLITYPPKKLQKREEHHQF